MKKSVIRAGIWGVMPWFVATVSVVALGASFFQMHAARDRYWKLAALQSTDHMHRETREFIIRAALADADQPIVVLGDSITEMARLPETIGGRSIINAGIGGARIADFETIAPILLTQRPAPSVIVIALGANDAGSGAIQSDYAALLESLKKLAPRLLSIGVSGLDGADAINARIKAAADSEGVPFVETPIPAASMLPDRVHLNAAGYRVWTPALVAAIARPSS